MIFEKFFPQKIHKIEKFEKTKEQLLEEFKVSLEKYGVKNIDCRLEGENLVMEQSKGSGIRGLGYDKNVESLWMCLDQKNWDSISENESWNANTIISIFSNFPGIVMERIDEKRVKVKIASDHPVNALAKLRGREKNVCLPGWYNNWGLDQPFKLNQETGELENILDWDGVEMQCKVAFIETPSEWDSGKWRDEAPQKLETKIEQ